MQSDNNDITPIINAIADFADFMNNERWKDIPPTAEAFINDNYHYCQSHSREHLVGLVAKEYGITDELASCWITHFTT